MSEVTYFLKFHNHRRKCVFQQYFKIYDERKTLHDSYNNKLPPSPLIFYNTKVALSTSNDCLTNRLFKRIICIFVSKATHAYFLGNKQIMFSLTYVRWKKYD